MIIPKSAVSLLEKEVIRRLTSFSDKQIMSLGSSLAYMDNLSFSTFQALRSEVKSRGTVMDGKHFKNPCKLEHALGDFRIAFENDDLAVINKPPGLVVSLDGDLQNDSTSRRHLKTTGESEEIQKILASSSTLPISKDPNFAYGILHRLDRGTSGALLIAKSFESFYDLRLQFACGMIVKEYTALATGWMDSLGKTLSVDSRIQTVKKLTKESKLNIESQISRDFLGMHALTEVTPVAHLRVRSTGAKVTLVRARIHTGRSHQIRVHLASLGHSLVNDSKYGMKDSSERIFLHASKLGFIMKDGNDISEIDVPLFEDFATKLSQLEHVSIDR
jgi:23S rRNA pseudouridine1911/1915/1917 synthase